MSMTTDYEELNVISDKRGVVFEPLETDAFSLQKNAHVVISLPGVVRGNHYHNIGKEIITVMGPALVRFRENDNIHDVKIPEGKVYRFSFPPGLSHAIKNLSNQPNILVAFNSIEHDAGDPDTLRDVLI